MDESYIIISGGENVFLFLESDVRADHFKGLRVCLGIARRIAAVFLRLGLILGDLSILSASFFLIL